MKRKVKSIRKTMWGVYWKLHDKRKRPMPSFYGKNIAQHAQRRFLARWEAEHRKKSDRILIADELDKAPDRTQEARREE